ncbi:MAG: DUF3857 domain-containing protein, partial [Kiritimatiellia bacterium]|nr:DUF3857 domain-containing protein [Kiritimatiellia bacterium]
RFPNADSVYVDGHDTEYFRTDGTGETWSDILIAVLTEKGVRDYRTLSFGFHEAYGDVRMRRIDLHKRDGRVIPVDIEAQSRVMVAPDQMASNIFDPREKVLQIGLPGLEPGDAIHLLLNRRQTKTRMPDFWGHWAVFESTDPILRDRLEIYAPAGLPLRHRVLKNAVAGTVSYEEETSGGWTRHRWTAQNVPQLFEEPNMPARHTVSQRLLLSTLEDWRAVSRWYWNLSRPRIEAVSPAMQEMVDSLIRDRPDREARIRAIFQFVSQQIRYMGITPEEEAPGYEPHDARMTFDNRYGVCRDKAALLAAMLRMAGFEAFPVLIDVGPKKDLDVPLPYFNHAITAVREPDGSYLLMDSTDETTRELLPTYLCNRSFLVATPEGETLLTSPIPPAEDNLLHIRTEARLLDDGRLIGTSTLRFEGINDNTYRGYFARIQPDERRRFFESLLKRAVPGGRMTDWSLTPENLQNTEEPVSAHLAFEAPDYPIAGSSMALLPPPLFGSSAGMVNFILGRTGLPERRYPLMTDYACGVRESFRMALPADRIRDISLPTDQTIRRPTLEWSRTWSRDASAIEGENVFLIHAAELSPEEYRTLKEDLRTMESEQRRKPVLVMNPGPPHRVAETSIPEQTDTRILRDDLRIEILGPGHWRETRAMTRLIQTYAGVKDHAEISIPYNPIWESAEAPVARVIAPDGTVREAGPSETHQMDSEWNASAPRYSPGRILVINLPGVEIGSRIETETVREFRGRPFVAGLLPLQGFEPADSRRIRIDRDWTTPLRWSDPAGSLWPVRSMQTDARLEWEVADIPAVPREDSTAPLYAFVPTVFFSSGQWIDLARRVQAVYLRSADRQPRTRKITTEILGELPRDATPAQRVRAIRDYVARRIRPAGPELGELPWEEVSPADRTLADGYGHSADRAILLFSLLRAGGFEPRFLLAMSPSLTASLRAPMGSYPQHGLFSQVLVAVDLEAEGTVYLNEGDP